jgi:hypothetical protein
MARHPFADTAAPLKPPAVDTIMIRDADILSLLLARRPDHSLERAFYTDPAVFDADMRTLYYRDWLMAAASAELPKTGAFVKLEGLFRADRARRRRNGPRLPQLLPPPGQSALFR